MEKILTFIFYFCFWLLFIFVMEHIKDRSLSWFEIALYSFAGIGLLSFVGNIIEIKELEKLAEKTRKYRNEMEELHRRIRND